MFLLTKNMWIFDLIKLEFFCTSLIVISIKISHARDDMILLFAKEEVMGLSCVTVRNTMNEWDTVTEVLFNVFRSNTIL
jgi:hypothetical protein